MRDAKKEVAVLALVLCITCASAASASGVGAGGSGREAQVAVSSLPPMAPGAQAQQQPETATSPGVQQPLDITGSADDQVQIDALSALLSTGPVADGGLEWDATSKKVVVRLVGDVNEKSTAMQARKTSVLANAKDLIAKGSRSNSGQPNIRGPNLSNSPPGYFRRWNNGLQV
ncbi:hypothetical protein [Kribbella sp. NPDC055071]